MRAQQFWDPQHLVAKALQETAKQKPPHSEPNCCVQKGFYWDDVILYGQGERWENAPTPVFWNGPVFRVIPGLEKAVAGQP